MINVIVAHDLNRCIGKDGKIPWNIKGEKKQFKELTTGNIVIMGRKTYEEIGKPLPNRRNIVITKNPLWDEVEHHKSLKKAISICLATDYEKDIYIAGGTSLYREVVEKGIPIDNYYITIVNEYIVGGDRFFPNFDKSLYNRSIIKSTPEYTRFHYKRKGD